MNSKHELFEELEAFDPSWQNRYTSVTSAAKAAKCEDLLVDWLSTHQGETYLAHIHATRDYLEEIREYQDLLADEESKLPFGYGNLSAVRGEYFGE